MKSSTPYVAVHTATALSQMLLNREHLPFLPLRCSGPEGPVQLRSTPDWPAEGYDIPLEFWQSSARDCFRAARDLVDLARACREWNALVKTPLVGFALYVAALLGAYCVHFPWMDPEGYLCTPPPSPGRTDPRGEGEGRGYQTAQTALEMVLGFRSEMPLAEGWFAIINRTFRYFRRVKREYQKLQPPTLDPDSPDKRLSPLSTRATHHHGFREAAADESRLLLQMLQNAGAPDHPHHHDDVEMPDADDAPYPPSSRPPYDAMHDDSFSGSTGRSDDHPDPAPASRPQAATSDPSRPTDSTTGPWHAVNATTPASDSATAAAGRRESLHAAYRPYDSPASYQAPLSSERHPHLPPPLSASQPQAQPSSTTYSSQPNYAHQINSFRPAAAAASSPPSSTHRRPFAASTDPSKPPHPWTPDHPGATASHDMGPPPSAPMSMSTTTATPAAPGASADPSPSSTTREDGRERWLRARQVPFGGDDVAAFVDGTEVREWVRRAEAQGLGGSWLVAVWRGRL